MTSLSLSTDGWTLLSAARDKVAVLWDLRKYAKLATVPVHEAVEGAQSLRRCASGLRANALRWQPWEAAHTSTAVWALLNAAATCETSWPCCMCCESTLCRPLCM